MELIFKEKLTQEQLSKMEEMIINVEELDENSITLDTDREEHYFKEHALSIKTLVQCFMPLMNIEVENGETLIFPATGEDINGIYKLVVSNNKVCAYNIVVSYSDKDILEEDTVI